MNRERVVFRQSSRGLLWRFLRTPLGELFRGRVTGPRAMPSDRWWARVLRTPWRQLLRGQIVASGLSEVVGEAGLPRTLGDIVLRVARKTRLWQDEQIDIAHELIAHFTDGLAHGRSADELITEFGDLKQTVKLMRRAKLRNRPFLWRARQRVLEGLGVALVIVAIPYLVLLTRYYFASPASVEVEPIAYLPERVASEDERAWPLYRRALADLKTLGDQEVVAPDGSSTYLLTFARPGDDAWGQLRASLEEQKEALALLRRGAQRPRLGFHAGEKEDEPALSHYREQVRSGGGDAESDWIPAVFLGSRLLPVVWVLQADVWRAAEDGKADVVLDDVVSMVRLAEQLQELKPAVSAQMISQIFLLQAPEVFGRILAREPALFSDEQLRGLAERLQTLARGESFRLDLKTLRRGHFDRLARLYSDDGQGDGRLTRAGLELLASDAEIRSRNEVDRPANSIFPGRRSDERCPDRGEPSFVKSLIQSFRGFRDWLDDVRYHVEAPTFPARVAGRREITELLNTLFDRLEAWASRPLWERGECPIDEWREQTLSSREQRIRFLPLLHLWSPPPTGEFIVQRIDATVTAIGLERYRRTAGSWPEELADLTPEYLARVPPDRFDGEALRYRLVGGEPLLYSVGVDGDDDGGRPTAPKPSDASLWPPPTGSPGGHLDGDWILWPPPEERF